MGIDWLVGCGKGIGGCGSRCGRRELREGGLDCLRVGHLLSEVVGGFDFVGVVVVFDNANGGVSGDFLEEFRIDARAAGGNHEIHKVRGSTPHISTIQ